MMLTARVTFGFLFIWFASLVPVHAGEKPAPRPKSFELVLGVWSQGEDPATSFSDRRYHLKIAVRNLGVDTISTAQSMAILLEGELYVGRPDGTQDKHPLGVWSGRAPSDIARGELAAHCINTAVDAVFPMEKPGRYLVWWSSGDMKSNVLVFDRDDQGLHHRP